MGRDKALLEFQGQPLIKHVAGIVEEVLGLPATIIGDPDRYLQLGYAVHADLVPNCGPLGGIVTALTLTKSDLNLVVACDMPLLTTANLRMLVERARHSQASCVAASAKPGELEPLCAVYHRRCLETLRRALRDKRLKMKDLLAELRSEPVSMPLAVLANVNTPEQWMEFEHLPR